MISRIASPLLRRHAARPLIICRAKHFSSVDAVKLETWDFDDKYLRLHWRDGHESCFLHTWLRDHCPQSLHPTSLQRNVDTLDILGSQPANVSVEQHSLQIDWDRAVTLHSGDKVSASNFSLSWLREHCYSRKAPSINARVTRQLWKKDEVVLPKISHDEWIRTDEGRKAGMENLYRYGCLVVQGTPTTFDGTQAAIERIGIPRATFYNTMWDTAPKVNGAVNDTAYTNLELKPHNDCCYLRDPPGLQVFNCAAQSAEGGQTWLVDAFAVAAALLEQDVEAFNFFATTPIPSHSIDFEHDVHVRSEQPIINLDSTGNVVGVRLNNDDRACLDNLSTEDVERFYEHIPKLLRLSRDPEYACNIKLELGDMLILENRRIMHGRREFHGFRNLVGCYMDSDMYDSRLRLLGIID